MFSRVSQRLLMTVFVGVASLSAAGSVMCTYSRVSVVSTGSNPRALATADLNGDGIPDLVTANLDAGTLSVLIGKGDGTFTGAVNYAVGNNPYQVIVADFNGDGKADLAAANFGGTDVSVLIGNGNGTFATSVAYTTGTKPRALVAADMNADGKVDLAVANSTATSVSLLRGNGDSTFQGKLDSSAGGTPHGIVAVDFNGDGKLDLAVANNSPNGTVSILLGNGAGGFGSPVTFTAGASPYGIATGDFNRDGVADLVTANFGAASLSVLQGNGDGTFRAATTLSAPGNPVTVRVADINGDGIPDVLAADFGAGSLDLFWGNGDGSFASVTSIGSLSGIYDVAAGDFDHDGIPDLAVAASGLGQVVILKGACPNFEAIPAVSPSGIVNAANGAAGISPGAWTSIYGSNLASTTYALTPGDVLNGSLPTAMKGTSVQINGKAAFLYYVSPSQINVQTPDDSFSGSVKVTVSTAAGVSAAASATLQPILPGLFAASGYLLGVRVSDGAILSDTSPARSGDTLELFGTGLGPASANVSAGLVFSGAYITASTASVKIGTISGSVLWSGLVGAGLYQINMIVPALADGDYPVTITIGGVTSQSTPLLRIRSQ